MDFVTSIDNVEVNMNGSDVEFTEAAASGGNTYVQGYDHETGQNFVMSAPGDGGVKDAGGGSSARKGAMEQFKGGLHGDALKEMFEKPDTFRAVISPDAAARGLDTNIIGNLDGVANFDKFQKEMAADAPITPSKLKSLRDEFMDVATQITKRVPAPVALAIGGMIMSNGAMAADELAVNAIPFGNAIDQALEGDFIKALMSIVDDFDPTVVGSEALRAFLYKNGANIEPPLMNALRDLCKNYLSAIEGEQERVVQSAIDDGVLPAEFTDPTTGDVVSALDILRDDVKGRALVDQFANNGNDQAVGVFEFVQDKENTREMVAAVSDVVDSLSPDAAPEIEAVAFNANAWASGVSI